MKSTKIFSSISIPLLKENLRRFWALPALSFLLYFFIGIFPVMMNRNYSSMYSSMYGYMYSLLSFQNFGYIFVHCLSALIAALMLFRYLHNVGSVSIMHSLPFTRKSLFITNYLSGLILLFAPILLCGLIMALMKAPVPPTDYMDYWIFPFEPLSVLHICLWFFITLVIISFVYALCVLAAMVTGNFALQLLVSVFFNMILPICLLVSIGYAYEFLFGFVSDSLMSTLGKLSPVIYFPISGFKEIFLAGISPISGYEEIFLAGILYIGITIGISLVAYFSYKKRPLEKSGDSTVFKWVEIFLTYVATFIGLSAFSFYFYMANSDIAYFYAGQFIGAILSFIICSMIAKKTPRIFTLEILKSFGIFAVIIVLFMASLNTGFFGFEKRVPAVSSVKSIGINIPNLAQQRSNHYNSRQLIPFEDPSNIDAITRLHEDIIAEFANKPEELTSGYSKSRLEFNYNLNSSSLQRAWHIPSSFYLNNENLKTIFDSDEYKAFIKPHHTTATAIETVYINDDTTLTGLSTTAKQELLDAISKDIDSGNFDELKNGELPYAKISISFSPEDYGYSYYDFSVYASATNTMNWLKANGFSTLIDNGFAQVDIAYTRLTHSTEYPDPVDYSQNSSSQSSTVYENRYKVQDSDTIQKIFREATTVPLGSGDFWEIEIASTKESPQYISESEATLDTNFGINPDFRYLYISADSSLAQEIKASQLVNSEDDYH